MKSNQNTKNTSKIFLNGCKEARISLVFTNNDKSLLVLRKIPESTVSANKVIITKSETNIENVVITPKRINGVKEPNVKLKKPMAVVNEVKKTGLPISIN